MVIFAALFIVFTTVLFAHVFHQRIKDFLQEDIIGAFFRRLSGNQNIDGGIRGSMEVGEEVKQLTPLSSSTKSTSGSKYEVFLSFRGEDTRKGFTRHLYDELELRGISTFMDSEKLEKGEEINKLSEYIERSNIFVPIFSKRFAESGWCLKEVTKSMEHGKEIVPVFFGVEPSDVCNQSGPFKSAFKRHESSKGLNQKEVKKWREALKKVGSLSGFNLKDMNGDEAKLKRAAIERVLEKVNKKPLEVAKHPIGIETRIQDVKKILEDGGNHDHHVHVVGIHGMGGLGKTTIAKAVYNEYLTEGFNGANCFLSNIREKSEQPNGLVDLQKQLIRDVLKEKDISLSDIAQGKILIKERASCKRVLLILDDVDSIEQIDALAGGRDWFGAGSVVIVTTRDEEVLLAHNVKQHEIYKPQELNEAESLELFMLHTFNGEQPHGVYVQSSNEVVAAAGGLPLTLEVIGSLLSSKKNVQEWKDILEKLIRIPPSKVQQRLKLSYDSLDDMEKKIFLDISCFFIGRRREYATYMWEDCGWFPRAAIRVLEHRSLVKIDEKSGEFEMHDQIRDMGRAIVEEESNGKLEKQSRLWNYQDSLDLLQRKVVPGIINAEGIQIKPNYKKCVSAKICFGEMPNLRYLNAEHVNFQGRCQYFATDLKWLELRNCKFDMTPFDFDLDKAIILELYETNITQILINQFPPRGKAFEKLKVLSIFCSPEIKMTPDFRDIPCLVRLKFHGCPALTTIDASIGKLKSLTYLGITNCQFLEKLPDSICNLSSLQVLDICWCSMFSCLPERLGDMGSLSKLDLGGTSVDKIPDSIGQLINLRELLMDDCRRLSRLPNSIFRLTSLGILDLRYCYSLASLPERLGDMESLRKLDIRRTRIAKIPDSIGQLTNLTELLVKGCERVSSSLEVFDLNQCIRLCSVPECLWGMESLKRLHLSQTCIEVIPDSIGQLTNLRQLSLHHSECLIQLPDSICQLCLLELLNLEGCSNLCSLPERLGDMEKLEALILDNTRIEVIPYSVGQLKNLRLLSLEGCKLVKALPSSITQLSSIRWLKMSGTSLKSSKIDLPPLAEINNMELTSSSSELLGLCDQSHKALKHLRLIDAAIEELPDCVGRMENLEELLLECEMLRALPNWIGLCFEKLTRLEIESKNLKALPDCIGSLKQLRELSLKCENLNALPNLIRLLKQMRQLKLNCVNLEALPDSIGELENISFFQIESTKLKNLPNSIALLRRVYHLELHCMSLEAIPVSVGGLKELIHFEIWSNSLKALPDSIRSLTRVWNLELKCPNLETLPDSIGELESLSSFQVDSHCLKYLPNSIGCLTRMQSLSLKCMNLEALPDSMETLQSLECLKLHCDNFTAPLDFIGRLENLESFSFKSKNLKYLLATIDESFGRLKALQLNGCENLEVLIVASIQQTGLARLSSLESLHLKDCKSLEYLPQLPSSLLLLDAYGCTNLRTMSDISNLKSLRVLNLGGCKLLEDVPGLENISNDLQALEMPGPCDFIECCHLSHDFRNKVLKEMSFGSLRRFKMSGCLVRGSATGQQQLHFPLPRLPFSWLIRARLTLGLDKVLSPVHVAIMANDIIVFEKIVELMDGENEFELNLRDENIKKTGEGEGEHCYTVQVTTEVSQLQNVCAVLAHRSHWY